MTELDLGLSIALVVLVAYLLWSFNRRLNAQIGKSEARYKHWQGKGFEASNVAARIERLRRDYAGEARGRHAFAGARREKVARARCVIRDLSFFRQIHGVAESAEQSNEKGTADLH